MINTLDGGDPSPAGSLRAAIEFANANPGTTIGFALPPGASGYGAGTWTIRPLSALPPIAADGTIIDGTTQAAFIFAINPVELLALIQIVLN